MKISPSDLSTIAVYDIDPMVLLATRRNDVPFVQLEDQRSVERNCSCLSDRTKELLVAQPEGVFGYSVAEQGSAIGIEGDKAFILSVGFNVLLICNEVDDSVVKIYDFKRRYICYEVRLLGVTVTHVFQDISSIKGELVMLYLSDGRVHCIRQLSPATIVKSFCEAEFFEEGLKIAAENQYPLDLLRHIYKSHGDQLYRVHQLEHALSKYICTIAESFEPSYVIGRYSLKEQSQMLVKYLLALAEAGYARKEHIRLLIHRLIENLSFVPEINRLINWMQYQGHYKEYIPELSKIVRSLISADRMEDAKAITASCRLLEEMIAIKLSYDSVDCKDLALEIVFYSRVVSSDRLQNLLSENAKTLEVINAQDLVALLILFSTKTADDSSTCCLSVSQCVEILRGCASKTRKMYLLNLPPSFSDEVALPLLDALLNERNTSNLGSASREDIERSILETLLRPIFRDEGIALCAIFLLREKNFTKGISIVVKNAFPASNCLLIHAISLKGDVNELVEFARDVFFQNRREYKLLLESAIQIISKGGPAKDGSSEWDAVSEIVQIAISRGNLEPSEVRG